MTVLRGMPFAEYLAVDAASKHGLELLLRSPAHYRHSLATPSEPTAAQALGSLTHALIQEPGRAALEYGVLDTDGRTRAGKEQREAFAAYGRTAVTREQMDLAEGMRDAVRAHPIAGLLYSVGKPELSLFWDDPETGLLCKARPDWYNTDHEVIVDLKTAADASEEGFSRAAGNYGYHMQDAHYLDGAAACGLTARGFIFVVVENTRPHAVAVYVLDDRARDAGRTKIRRALNLLAECKREDKWPGYPAEIKTLELKPWSL